MPNLIELRHDYEDAQEATDRIMLEDIVPFFCLAEERRLAQEFISGVSRWHEKKQTDLILENNKLAAEVRYLQGEIRAIRTSVRAALDSLEEVAR